MEYAISRGFFLLIMYGSPSDATQTSFVVKFVADQGDSRYVDVPQCLSLINRRKYPSGVIYPVSVELEHGDGTGDTMSVSTGAQQSIEVESLPNTYIIRQSYKLAKEMFLKATKEERKMLKSARWNDFRCMFDAQHKANYAAAIYNALPITVMPDGSTVNQDTGYEYSYIANREIPGNDMFYTYLGNSNATTLGMVEEYFLSMLASQAAPDPVATLSQIPYDDIIEQVDDADADALQEVNEFPPYDEEVLQTHMQRYYVGMQNGVASSTGISYFLKQSTPVFLAPGGLLKFTNTSGSSEQTTILRINCLAGELRGIEAGDMDWK